LAALWSTVFGWWRYALLLIGAVYGSAIFQSRAIGGENAVVGASGMIAGILGAFVVVHPKATIKVFFLSFFLFRFDRIPVPAVFFLLAWWLQDLLRALDSISRGQSDGIAHPAHLSGFLIGIGLAVLLHPPQLALYDAGKPWPRFDSFFRPREPPSERQVRLQRAFDKVTEISVYIVLILFAGLCVYAVARRLLMA
jgi:hypothetical protein